MSSEVFERHKSKEQTTEQKGGVEKEKESEVNFLLLLFSHLFVIL